MSPWIIGFLCFTLYPMLASLYYSFTRFDLISNPQWVGLQNYRDLFTTDPYFRQAIRNTLFIVAFGVPLNVLFGVGIAMMLTKARSGASFYRTVFYLPTLAPAVAVALTFMVLFNPGTGPVNQVLGFLHIGQPLWFYDPNWSKPALLILGLWTAGNTMIIFLAALLNVPRQLYEAIEIEGAGPFRTFIHVTIPMISPVIFFAVVTGVIDALQYFTQAYVIGNAVSQQTDQLGEPQGSLLFYALWMYQKALPGFAMGYAAAMAWILFLVTMIATLILFKTSSRWVFYQGSGR
jgi:multiple sugar transport system permease protein